MDNLEQTVTEILKEDSQWIIDLPTNQEAVDQILSLKNSSIKITSVDFGRIDVEESIDEVLLELPTTQEEIDQIYNVYR